jgi:sulfotransferase
MKKFYFISGLPRSGSTVLRSILNQNSRFYAGAASPVLSTMYSVESHLQNDELFHAYPKPQQANLIISNIIHQFYSDVNHPVVFDSNRAWPARVPYIENYIKQDAKIICTVRDYEEILTSFEILLTRNPYEPGQKRINFIDEQLVKLNVPLTLENRCEYIASPQGILGQSANAIIEGIQQGNLNKIHFVEYKNLINSPEETLNSIYDFLGEDKFNHTFTNLINQTKEQDLNTYGLKDMHEVRKELKSVSANPKEVLPQEILDKCKDADFWRRINIKSV